MNCGPRKSLPRNTSRPIGWPVSYESFGDAALKALAKLGDAEFVRQYLAQRGDADAKRLAQRIDFELKRPRGTDSLCWN
jgi:hypothetical protein